MFQKINLINNDFNFAASFSVEGAEYYIRFKWQDKENVFLIDMGRGEENILLSGVPALVGVELNKGITDIIPGTLFLDSIDPKIEKPDFNQLGEQVNLYHYIDD